MLGFCTLHQPPLLYVYGPYFINTSTYKKQICVTKFKGTQVRDDDRHVRMEGTTSCSTSGLPHRLRPKTFHRVPHRAQLISVTHL